MQHEPFFPEQLGNLLSLVCQLKHHTHMLKSFFTEQKPLEHWQCFIPLGPTEADKALALAQQQQFSHTLAVTAWGWSVRVAVQERCGIYGLYAASHIQPHWPQTKLLRRMLSVDPDLWKK